jgi:hypothetical protein
MIYMRTIAFGGMGRFIPLVLFAAAFGVAACGTSQAQLTTLAYDGFNYTAGASLSGQNGGVGWTGSWTQDYPPGAPFIVSGTGMTYPGLTSSGGSIVWSSGGVGISEDSRTLPLINSGVVYIQFLAQFTESSSLGTPNIRLYDSGNLTGGFGGNGGSTMSILNLNLQPDSSAASSSAPLANANFVIARIDYQNDDTEMWVNPDLSTFNYANPTAPDAIDTDLAPAFNMLSIYSRDDANVDEIQISSIPEPSIGALTCLAIALLFPKLRRRPSALVAVRKMNTI